MMTEFEKLKFAYSELYHLYEKELKKRRCNQSYLANIKASLNALRSIMYALNELAPKLELDFYEEDEIACASVKVKGYIHEDTYDCLYNWKGKK